jgi:uncharacterized lipoprotein YmbA
MMPKLHIPTGLIAVLLIGTACSSSPASRFYTLDVAYDGPVHTLGGQQLGVGPFEMPSYLDRPQIVVRGDGNRLVVSEFDRWADALPERFERVLVRDLVIATGSPAILSHPWRRDFDTAYHVTGVVDRFEADRTGTVVLEVRWAVIDSEDGGIGSAFHSVYREDAEPGDYGAITSAMSRAVAAFAGDIAADAAARLGR